MTFSRCTAYQPDADTLVVTAIDTGAEIDTFRAGQWVRATVAVGTVLTHYKPETEADPVGPLGEDEPW